MDAEEFRAKAEAAQRSVHAAVLGYLEDDEIAVDWVLTVQVQNSDGVSGLLHRAGGGMDGSNGPSAWAALGMLQASSDIARDQMKAMTAPGGQDAEPE